jgi:hypothetical protein
MADTIDSLIVEDYTAADENGPNAGVNDFDNFQKNLVDRMAQQFSISVLEEALKAASLRAEGHQIPARNIPRTVDLDNIIQHSSATTKESPKVSQKNYETGTSMHSREKSSTQVILYRPTSVFPVKMEPIKSAIADAKLIEQQSKPLSSYDESKPIVKTINDEQNQLGQYNQKELSKSNTSIKIVDDAVAKSTINETFDPIAVKEELASHPSFKRNLASEDNVNQKSIQSLETLQQNLNPDSQPSTSHTISKRPDDQRLNRSISLDKHNQGKQNELGVAILSNDPFSPQQAPDMYHSESSSKSRRSDDISHQSPHFPSTERNREIKGNKRKNDFDKSKTSQAWESHSLEKNELKHVTFNNSETNKVRFIN